LSPRIGAFIAALCFVAPAALAQGYPSKPVRLIVGFVPGGGTDVTARLLAQRLAGALGQNVIVENRPGAGGLIASESVARAPGDGYTLLMTSAPDAAQPALRKTMPFDAIRDFSPVALVATGPFVLVVHPVVPASTARDLIALARAQPGRLNYGSSGIASSAHIANELFNAMAKVRIVHVPYKGAAEGVAATAAGEVDMIFASAASAQPLMTAGKVKGLGVSVRNRVPMFPDLPTIAESGLPGYERYGWYGVTSPSSTPAEIVNRLNAEIARVVKLPDLQQAYMKQGLVATSSTPAEFAAFFRDEIAQTTKLVAAAGVKLD